MIFLFLKGEKIVNKELLELLDQINKKKEQVRNYATEGKLEEAKKAKDELKELQNKFDILKDLDDGATTQENKVPAGTPKDSTAEFAQAARNGFRVQNSMSEGSKADGGYTVPEDIQTRINEYKDSKFHLGKLVKKEGTKNSKGSRTFKKRSQQTGFQEVGEGGKITAKSTPQFERIDYEIKKYAGYFPVTNELLSDSDANIAATLIEWIGDESRVTENLLILRAIKTKEAVEIKDMDGIKEVLNVTLGAAFKGSSKIITNDDGLQYLDTIKDSIGRYFLAPDPRETMPPKFAAGGTFVQIEVVPKQDLPSELVYEKTKDTDVATSKSYYTETEGIYTKVTEPKKGELSTYYEVSETKIPMIIGDLHEGIYYFDRNQRTIKTSDTAAIGNINAFEEDLTIYRAIEREDVRVRDKEAFVNGYLSVK